MRRYLVGRLCNGPAPRRRQGFIVNPAVNGISSGPRHDRITRHSGDSTVHLTQDDLTRDISLPRLAFRLGLDPARLARARERVRDYLWLHCDDERLVDEVVLSVEEACTNAIRHSGAKDAMEVSLSFSGDDLVVTARDCGHGFDLASFDRNAPPDPLASGGRGLFLMAQLMDELELRLDGGLEVRMLKRSVSCSPSIVSLDPALGHAAGTRQWARTQSFLEEIGEAFFALDWEYRYIHANRLGLRLTGKSLEQLHGHTPWELFPGLEDSQAAECLSRGHGGG